MQNAQIFTEALPSTSASFVSVLSVFEGHKICALYVCHTHVLDLISPHHSSKQAESVASFSMNVDELPYRGMLILIQLDVSVSVFLLVCTCICAYSP